MLADFQAILDRDDCDDAKATTFLIQGMSRIQRDCRLPSMERTLIITTEGPTTMFPVPVDLIQPIDVLVQDEAGEFYPLDKKGFRQLLRIDPGQHPCAYARVQTVIHIRGTVPAGRQIMFLYYGNFSAFADGDSDNELSASTPDFGVYAGLAYAGEEFQHPNADRWEARYQAIKQEVMAMAVDLDAEGGPQTVSNPYCDPDL